jgi:hypothetical protein
MAIEEEPISVMNNDSGQSKTKKDNMSQMDSTREHVIGRYRDRGGEITEEEEHTRQRCKCLVPSRRVGIHREERKVRIHL